MKVTILGTSSAVPTPMRSLPGIAVFHKGRVILFDCGESTQLQLQGARLSLQRVSHIFLTHLHGDHLFGLPGLLHSMALNRREKPLSLYCPAGEGSLVARLLSSGRGEITYPVELSEMEAGQKVDLGGGLKVEAAAADHTVPALAYRLQEAPFPGRFDSAAARKLGLPQGPLRGRLQKGASVDFKGRTIRPEEVVGPPRPGRSLVYSGDTRPCRSVIALAQGARLLIHEATFDDSLADHARESAHSTAGQAAGVAAEAEVEQLVLTHFSQRYKQVDSLVEQARAVFPATQAAHDLLELTLDPPA